MAHATELAPPPAVRNGSTHDKQTARDWRTESIENLIEKLTEVRDSMNLLEASHAWRLSRINENYRRSAANLIHYMALRRHDLRDMQERLAELGLSSLGRCEPHVKDTIESLLAILHCLANRDDAPKVPKGIPFQVGRRALDDHTRTLLGPLRSGRDVQIMVTMPSTAAEDYELVRDLVVRGMDLMRINCAHDDQNVWRGMIENLKRAMGETGHRCRVLMDLAGPKLRTGEIEPGPRVAQWRPQRDTLGRVKAPALVWLTASEAPHEAPDAVAASLPIDQALLERLRRGDRLRFFDARGAARSLLITERTSRGCHAESDQTVYMRQGTVLLLESDSLGETDEAVSGRVGELAPTTQGIALKNGDLIVLTSPEMPGANAVYNADGKLLRPAHIGVSHRQLLADVAPGEKIWFDDGKIGGIVEEVAEDEVHVRITQARARGARLLPDKGINFPDSEIHLPSLTDEDIANLPFVASWADIVGYSFVRTAADVQELQSRLRDLGGESLGIVLKIETGPAFERLPELILTAMSSRSAGVMIARGDLGVECGFERMAEVQEEILWICEAAHLPVIWATQVLENLAKDGMPSRAEITDAAMGVRAECVMLNKGPYILKAVRALDDILRRMQSHQHKKRSMLRKLSLAETFESV